MKKRPFRTLLADRHLEHACSQAPAWERAVLEALPPEGVDQTTIGQAEPAIHWVPRRSLGTGWWCSARSVAFQSQFLSFFLLALTVLWATAQEGRGGVILTLSLGGPTQLSPNQVAFDIKALFTSANATDYVNSFIVTLQNSDQQLSTNGTDYSRFSLDSFLQVLGDSWEGAFDNSSGVGLIVAPDINNNLVEFLFDSPTPKVIARLLVDTTGLGPGTYTASLFDSSVSDASGFISGNPENSFVFAPPQDVIVNLNASSSFVTGGIVTTVPEPSSYLSMVAIGGIGLIRLIRKKK